MEENRELNPVEKFVYETIPQIKDELYYFLDDKFEYVIFYANEVLPLTFDAPDIKDATEVGYSGDVRPFAANYDDIVKQLEKKGITEFKFRANYTIKNEVQDLKYEKHIDIDRRKLWVLCVAVYHYIDSKRYAIYEPTGEEQMFAFGDFMAHYDTTSMQLKGVGKDGTEVEILIDNSLLLDKLGVDIEDFTDIEDEVFKHKRLVKQILNLEQLSSKKGVIDYLLIEKLEPFFFRYFKRKTKDISTKEKQIILEILKEFGRFKDFTPAVTAYRKIKSDWRGLVVDENAILNINGQNVDMPFTFIPRYPYSKHKEGDTFYFTPELRGKL